MSLLSFLCSGHVHVLRACYYVSVRMRKLGIYSTVADPGFLKGWFQGSERVT